MTHDLEAQPYQGLRGRRKKFLRKWLRTGRERGGKTERESLSITGFHRMLRHENAALWQEGREIFPEDVAYIRTFAKRFPALSRTELTCTLCEHLDWLTPAGQPKYEACSKLLARLEDAGELRLPSIQKHKSHPGPRSCAARGPSARTDPPAPLVRPLSQLDPVRLRWASDPAEERLWNAYVERYHPLGYKKPFGYWARYFIDSGAHRLGCILL
ncbi:MAG: DUF4338 domain-containing protein, partial [Sulfitobacter sp.]|nr:DUF4338 domain-containing protein [Sulfitobacter sp.]